MAQDVYRVTNFRLSLKARIREYLDCLVADPDYSGFETRILKCVNFINEDTPEQLVLYDLRVAGFMCNKNGVMHGGAISTIFDNLSSTALLAISEPGFWHHLGVSRSLAIWFHRPLPVDMRLRLECSVVVAGKRMATVRAVLKDCEGRTCASCIHEKYFVDDVKI